MANARGWMGCSAVLVIVLGAGAAAHAAHAARADSAPTPADTVPEVLRPWIGWVLHGPAEEQLACPQLNGREDDRVCAWPARLSLAVTDKGGTFSQEWEVFHAGLAKLPGSDEHWPLDVRVDGKPAAVVSSDDNPALELAPGHHQVTGRFVWDESPPDSVSVPAETGLLALTVNGKRVDFPGRDEDGQVFFGRNVEEVAEADSIDISVHRKLIDDVPLRLITRLQLAVSGKNREVVLGRALPAGFEAQAVEGGLPLRFDPDGHVRIQVRPGTWTILVTARRVAAGDSVTRPRPEGLWKDGEEVWVFESHPALRVVDLSGAPAIDPAQTTLPDEWKTLPAYALPPGATLALAERRRGDSDAGPDQLQLSRRLWLDFDGGGYTVSDQISGLFTRSWRLVGAAHTRLGRVAINGQDQFITRDAEGHEGVEIRSGRANISADSRIEGRRWHVPATSFLLDFQSVSTTLMIPPGWRLIHATGADKVTGTWIDRWSLLNFFLLLVTTLAAQRLFGWRLALLAFVGIGLSITESDAPAAVWLAVLVGEALARALRAGKLHMVARWYRIGAWIALASILFPYAVAEVRRGVHPAAERESGDGVAERYVSAVASGYTSDAVPPASQPPAFPLRASSPAVEEQSRAGGSFASGSLSQSEDKKADAEGGKAGGGDRRYKGFLGSKSVSQNRSAYDPSVVVQTGPGLPTWSWDAASLTFNAPVRQDQELQLWLAPPPVNLALSLARAALLIALALLILRRPMRLGSAWHESPPLLGGAGPRAGIVLLLLTTTAVLAASSGLARAADPTTPSPELLEQLKQRLLEPPRCAPDCGAINRLALEATRRELQLVLEVSAAARTAIPLPGNLKDWVPAEVRLDGKSVPPLVHTDDGTLWLALPAGAFRVEMTGPLPARETIQIALPLKPRFVSAHVRGWTLDGLHEDGAADESLKLSRAGGGAEREEAPPDEPGASVSLAPFLRVTRTLHLGLKWEVETVVARETPTGAPVVIDVPLLPGEAVTTAGVRVDKAKAAVNVSLGPDATELNWQSTLTESPALRLRADPAFARSWSETWLVDLGATWHATFAGIPPIQRADADGARTAEWRPWPGEEVRIELSRPAGAGGQTLTIDTAELEVSPGTRMTRASLSLSLRSSRGTQHAITLAAGAELEGVTLDGRPVPLHLESDGRHLVLPIAPRKQVFAISWREPTPLTAIFRAPAVDVGVPATNVITQIHLAEAPRWMLWVAGPRLGPAVHIWSIVVVLLVLGWVLGRTRLTPLRWWDWTLLGIGMAQLPLQAAGVVALFLLALGWRARNPVVGRALLFDLSQIAFVGLTIAAVAILFGAIEQGLVSHPDMRVVGNGSNDQMLRWYQDRTLPLLPRPWIVSAPLMVYRGAMLAWSLWLALACLRWARWVWTCLREHGWWRPLRTRRAAPEAPAVPPAPAEAPEGNQT